MKNSKSSRPNPNKVNSSLLFFLYLALYKDYLFFLVLLILVVLFALFAWSYVKEAFDNEKSNSPPIPLNIFSTWHTKDLPPKMAENVESLKKKNPEFKHYLYDEQECRDFIQTHFDKKVLDAYNCLVPKAFKADLWRYCVLYVHGGIYMDIKFNTVDGFKLIQLTDKEYFGRDLDGSGRGILNGFIVCKPKNAKCWSCIQKIIENVEQKYYGDTALSPTGPNLLKQFFTEEEIQNMEISFEGEDSCPTQTCLFYKGKAAIYYYKEYRDEQSQSKEPSYFDLWSLRNIYSCH